MDRICAWCGKKYGTKDGCGTEGSTHGCCPSCYDRVLAESGVPEDRRTSMVIELQERLDKGN